MNLMPETNRQKYELFLGDRRLYIIRIVVSIVSLLASIKCYVTGQIEFLVGINIASTVFLVFSLKCTGIRPQTEEVFFDEKLAQTFDMIPVPMCILEAGSLKYVKINVSAADTFGYSQADFIGEAVKMHSKLMTKQQYNIILTELRAREKISKMETYFYNKEGVLLSGLLSVERICLAENFFWLCVWHDITQIKNMKRELQRLDSFNVVSKMAVSLAHEIRNPMTTVRGFLQLAEQRSLLKTESVNMMIGEIDRANAIITQFLFMAKERMSDFKLRDINKIIKNVLPLVEKDAAKAGHYVDLESGQIPLILADENQIKQMLINIMLNGIEAMKTKGRLLIRTYAEESTVILDISDEGPGIPPEIIQQIGTPFFTTKEDAKGLGLAVCYSIAARHGAEIKIHTGQTGTTFHIQFKAAC